MVFLCFPLGVFTANKHRSMNVSLEAKIFEDLKEAVFVRRPILREIYTKCGHKSLLEYAQDYFDVNRGEGLDKRQEEFLVTFKRQVAHLLGTEVAESAAKQLKKYYFVSTADHHGPICDPFFLNSNLVNAIAMRAQNDADLQHVIVLSCANVSLNNSTFPRGLTFDTVQGTELKNHRLSFLPSNSHSCSVYHFRSYLPDEITKLRKLLEEKVKNGEISQTLATKVTVILEEIYNQPDVLQTKNFSEQITKTNYTLWKYLTGNGANNAPGLIYVEQESLVIELLKEHHLGKKTSIHETLFNPRSEALIYKYFDGIMGAFTLSEKIGTYLFWGISHDKNFRVQLWKKGNNLVSDDGTVNIPFTPEGLRAALEEGHIIPSMLLIFMVLSLYYGLKCLGGFSQVNYLTWMKEAYLKMHAELGNKEDVQVATPVQTKELGEDLTIAFAQCGVNNLTLATGLDLILYHGKETWPILTSVASSITLSEALGSMFPSFYRVAYAGPTRDERLMSLTAEDITGLLELNKKTKPCISIG